MPIGKITVAKVLIGLALTLFIAFFVAAAIFWWLLAAANGT